MAGFPSIHYASKSRVTYITVGRVSHEKLQTSVQRLPWLKDNEGGLSLTVLAIDEVHGYRNMAANYEPVEILSKQAINCVGATATPVCNRLQV
jgi:hypothetical protein